MTSFFNFIANNLSLSLIIAFGFIVLLVSSNILLLFLVFQIKKRLKILFQGRKASDLEGILAQQIKRQIKSEKEIKELFKSSRDLWKMSLRSIQKVGVVRFNPFKDTGSDQSFTVALLDSFNNGVVISSLFTREGTRIYSKPIEKGQSKYPLTDEEKEAIRKAKREQ